MKDWANAWNSFVGDVLMIIGALIGLTLALSPFIAFFLVLDSLKVTHL